MSIALIVGRDEEDKKQWQWFIDAWQKVLLARDPTLKISVWPDIKNPDEIDFVMVWKAPLGALTKFPNAKCIASLGAGVDHLFLDPHIPQHIPIVRVLDPYMANDILQYVMVNVLHHVKRSDKWEADQVKRVWDRVPPFNYSDAVVGVMGLGYLGKKAAIALHHVGLNVIGWSNSTKEMRGISCYAGKDQFKEFLSKTNILVCMIPLTKDTRNILNKKTFSWLPKGAYIVNLARGEHIVDEDLIAALDNNHLMGACLDVFRQEPLPMDHPFWLHQKIRVTPHIASVTNPATAVDQLYENYQRAITSKELLNLIDVTKGY